MKKQTLIAAALLSLAGGTSAYAISTTTAQSIWVDFSGVGGSYVVTSTETWKFRALQAVPYYTTLVSGPVVSCTGGGSGGANCLPANQPAAPTAPDAKLSEIINEVQGQGGSGQVFKDKCAFWSGGDLTTRDPYTQRITKAGLNGRGNWTFEWSYTVTPVNADSYANPPAARTAWEMTDSSGSGTAELSVGGRIASQSVVVSNQFPTGKYSFSLLDSLGLSRVSNLVLGVNDGTSTVTYPMTSVETHNLNQALAGEDGAADFDYVENAGRNPASGTTAALAALVDGDARSVLNGVVTRTVGSKTYQDIFGGVITNDTRNFQANNNGGSDGIALAYAAINAQSLSLGAGTYTITLTGTIKGNTANASSQSFMVTQQAEIDAEQCD